MVRSLLLTVASALLLTAALTYFYGSTYPYVLASEEARASIVVTDPQLAELRAATKSSDKIAYAILGAVICGVMPLLVAVGQPIKKQLIGAVVGMALGAIAGFAAAHVGHWFDNNPSIDINDAAMHVLVRWLAMLAPLAIACGIAVGIANGSAKSIAARSVGAIVGVAIASGLYSFLSGILTIAEEKHKIFPSHGGNRAMIIGCLLCFIGLVMLLQYNSEQATLKKSSKSTE